MAPLPPFQMLLDDHREEVMRFLVAAIGPDDAEDCFQETFLSALRAYPKVNDASNLRGWLLTIASRKAIDRHRGRRELPVGAVEDRPGTSRVLSAQAHQRRNGDGKIWPAVASLAPKQRTAVALRYACDLAYPQVAELMGTSEDAARRNVHEGIKRLREELDDE